ncbi:hypothetical protein A3Q56_02110 [Intoshia linei]|uniref:Uncharacterized protein n=1 Tax=Intoshia linei TaxID=1819745 RepID=A0A177B8Z8_9BILA|nr:hypothetical protein A3Q56_02110 [Intoshia linei]
MDIPITGYNLKRNPIKEHVMFEFQGSFKCRNKNDMLDDKTIGDLVIKRDDNMNIIDIFLLCGHVLIKGKLIDLEKPLMMMKKNVSETGIQYNVERLITKKILFDSRPTPVFIK